MAILKGFNIFNCQRQDYIIIFLIFKGLSNHNVLMHRKFDSFGHIYNNQFTQNAYAI